MSGLPERTIRNQTFVVVDVETTGTAHDDRVCEIGLTRIRNGRVTDVFETLVNPGVVITNTVFHGIQDWMVEEAPSFHEVAAPICRFIGSSVLIAHNAPFDMRFLRYELNRLGTDLSHFALCTLKMSRRLHPDFPYHRLEFLLERYNIVNEWPHRAGSDSTCEAMLFIEMSKKMRAAGMNTLRSFEEWGLPYDHRWCSRTVLSRGNGRARLFTRDDL